MNDLKFMKTRLAAFEQEVVRLDRARDELKEEIIKLRAEIRRRESAHPNPPVLG